MKLLSCYVNSFGKLQNFSYDFTSELNVINQENGWGKSTFSTFIKAMFYGLEDGKRDVENNERKKYKTWQSDKVISGYIEFESQGKKYRVNRTFGKKNSEDEICIYDLDSSKEITKEFENPFDIGEYFFKVDVNAFKSTIYFSQKDLTVSNSESLSACITPEYNLGKGDSVEVAIQKLDAESKKYKKQRGEGGLIDEAKRELLSVEEDIDEAKNGINSYNSISEEIKELENKIILTRDNLRVYANKKDLMQKYQSQKNILEQISRKKDLLKEKIDKKMEILSSLGKESVSKIEVENFSKLVKEYESVEQKIKSLEEEVTKLLSLTNSKIEKKSVLPTTLLVSSIIFFVVGIIMFVLAQTVLGAVFEILGGATLIFFIVLILRPSSKEDIGVTKEISKDNVEIERLHEVKAEKLNLIESFTRTFKFAFTSYSDFENVLRRAIFDLEQLDFIINDGNLEIKELESKVENLDVTLLDGESEAFINERYAYFNKTHNEESMDLARLREKLNRYDEYIVALPQLESKRASLNEKILTLEKEYDVYVKTAFFLNNANEELKKKYRQPLEDRLNKYIKKIAGNKFNRVSVDTDLNIFVEDGGKLQESAYFSQGFKNLFNICERFALIDMLFEKEKPFIILDDPFTNLDKDKIKEAISLIKEFAKEFQIIYFSCHDSRA